MKHVPAKFGVLLLAAAISANLYAQQAQPAAVSDPTKSDQAKADAKAKKAAAAKAEEENAIRMDSIIVTGTRSPKAVDKIAGAITLVTKEEIAHTLLVTDDATAVLARTVPGYAESSQAMSNTGETLRGRIALRLFDGIPQGSPLREGGRSATFTDMGMVGRIEVINGPSASEGIGAAGGIINYLSKDATKEGVETTITSRYSTQFGTDSSGWKLGVNTAVKQGDFDFVGGISRIDRGISYDSNGRRIGMNTSGSVSDSSADNIFLKGGYTFGASGDQRIQLTYSHFKIEGNGDYIQVLGCRGPTDDPPCATPRTNTSERGHIFGSKAEFNDFKQYSAKYLNNDFLGGSLVVDAYRADQAMRYLPEDSDDKQLVKVPPIPAGFVRIFDQSEIDSKKHGIRASWTRSDLFNIAGLELHTGVDRVYDEAQQRLALTNRVWVPPMQYDSTAPYAQFTYDIGPVTLSAGYRREDGNLHVDDYVTSAYRNSVSVKGGGVTYTENLKNAGAIWRIGDEWSVFASYGEGFGLPNIGIPLRNINVPGQSVNRIADIAAIVVKNTEFGFNWRGERASVSASHYNSKSPFGASLAIDPLSNDFVLTRAPVQIKGIEISGDWKFNDEWKASALYSRIRGFTAFYAGSVAGLYPAGPLVKPMGVLDINPDKLGASVTWKFTPGGDMTLGATKLMSRDLHGTGTRPYDGNTYSYREKTTGYTLFDFGLNYQTDRFGRFSLGVENLFNKQYILSWSQLAGYQNYWAGRGRMVSITHQLTF